MHLIIFDIDGTLIHHHEPEGDCFEQALNKVTGISQISKDMRDYEHVTDTGIANTCMNQHLNRAPTPQELMDLEEHFVAILANNLQAQPTIAIAGANEMLDKLSKMENIALGIATGCFYRTAHLKLNCAQLSLEHLPIGSSNDHMTRVGIMQQALNKAKKHYQREEFSKITYVGDGPWDIVATKALDWQFIGVASQYSQEELQALGAKRIVKDYQAAEDFLTYL